VNRTILRIAAVVLSLTGLSGCAALQESQIFQPEFWVVDGPRDNSVAELGLGELAKGNNVRAQAHFERALRANPDDVQALFGSAMLYQNSGQPIRAQRFYERILALQPAPTDELLVWADKQTQPIVDLAAVNLQLLKGDMNGAADRTASGGGGGYGASPALAPQRPGALQRPMATVPVSRAPGADSAAMFQAADLNVVARFKTIRALLDQGLVTQDEFLVRRKVNLGALLPMTSPPAAAGIDRPVPATDQVAARLRAIGRALEMRVLSPAQHTAERSMILDALMPVRPTALANPVAPPKGLMEAADAVRRLELLKGADLITSDEYARERAAIEAAIQPPPPKAKMSEEKTAEPLKASKTSKTSGFQPGVHLASYRQKKSANRGWADLSKRFKSVLGGLQYRIERVDLGNKKGVFYRLKAGPLPDNNAAKAVCRQFKAKRQYCEPTTINFG